MMNLLVFSLSSIILQAYYDAPTSYSPLFILVLLVILGIILWMRIKNKEINSEDSEESIAKKRKEKRILWSAGMGWLMFSISVVVIDDSGMAAFLSPRLWLITIPGALFGAIVGILISNNKERSLSSTTKNEETLESKIKGLKKLLDEGLLTQEEFAEQKKRILND